MERQGIHPKLYREEEASARAYVEPATVVKAGHIWAGRPAKEFRPVSDQERNLFARGRAVYVAYAAKYLAQAAA